MVKNNRSLWINCLIIYVLQFLSFIYKPFLIVELVYLTGLIIFDTVGNKILYLFFMLPFYNVFRFEANATQYIDILSNLKSLYLSVVLVLIFCVVMLVKFIIDVRKKRKTINWKEIGIWVVVFLLLIIPINKINESTISSLLTLASLFASLFFIIKYREDFKLKKILYVWLVAVILAVVMYAFKWLLPNLNSYLVQFERRFSCLHRDPNYFAFELMVLLIGYTILMFKREIKYEFIVAFITVSVLGVLSISKTFLIVFALYCVICLIYLLKFLMQKFNSKKQKVVICLVAFAVVAVITLAVVLLLPKLFNLRNNLFNKTENTTSSVLNGLTTGRFGIWLKYFKILFSSFGVLLFGYGALNGYPYDAIHNSFIQFVFFGGLLLSALMALGIIYCIKNHKKPIYMYLFTLPILLFLCALDMLFSYRTYLISAIFVLIYNQKSNSYSLNKSEGDKTMSNNNKNNYKVSIIIPVYKVEKFLDRCLTSIVNQEYKNLEIILVEDGSPDKCPEICDDWAKKDSRIKVIHKQNGGVSSARNMGLDIASGDYITFVDSDDYLSKDFSLCLRNIADRNVYCFPYYAVSNDNSSKISPNYNWKEDEVVEDLNEGKVSAGLYNAIWNKIFKASTIKENNLRFDTNYVIAEDLKFVIDWFKVSNEMSFINIPYYNYFQNDGSVMQNVTFKKIENTLSICEYGISILSEIENKKTKKFLRKLISENLLTVFVRTNKYEVQENQNLVERLKKCKKYISYGSTLSKKMIVLAVKIFGVACASKMLKIFKKILKK